MSLEEEREQFLKEHSEIAKTLFGDRTDLTDDEWYDLAMAAGNPTSCRQVGFFIGCMGLSEYPLYGN